MFRTRSASLFARIKGQHQNIITRSPICFFQKVVRTFNVMTSSCPVSFVCMLTRAEIGVTISTAGLAAMLPRLSRRQNLAANFKAWLVGYDEVCRVRGCGGGRYDDTSRPAAASRTSNGTGSAATWHQGRSFRHPPQRKHRVMFHDLVHNLREEYHTYR